MILQNVQRVHSTDFEKGIASRSWSTGFYVAQCAKECGISLESIEAGKFLRSYFMIIFRWQLAEDPHVVVLLTLRASCNDPLVTVGPGSDIVLRSIEPSTVTHSTSRLSGTCCEWRQNLLRELLCRTCGLDGTVVVLARVRSVAHGQVLSFKQDEAQACEAFIPHFCELSNLIANVGIFLSLETNTSSGAHIELSERVHKVRTPGYPIGFQ